MSIIKKFSNFLTKRKDSQTKEVENSIKTIDVEKLKSLQCSHSDRLYGKKGLEGTVELSHGKIYITYNSSTQRDGNAYTRGRESKLAIERDLKILEKEFPKFIFTVEKRSNGIYCLVFSGEKIDEEEVMDYIRDILVYISDEGVDIDFAINTHFPVDNDNNNKYYEMDFIIYLRNVHYDSPYQKLEPYMNEIESYLSQNYNVSNLDLYFDEDSFDDISIRFKLSRKN